MKKINLLVLFISINFMAFAQSPTELKVAATVEKLRLAMVSGERAALEELASTDLSYGHSSGKIEDKAAFVESIASGKSDFVTIDFKDQTIKEVLAFLLSNTSIIFKEVNGGIVLSAKPKPPKYGTLKGRVVDFEASEPLPGATIRVEQLKRGAVADSKGYYQFKDLPEGKYTLSASYITYETTRLENIQVTENKETIQDFKIKPSAKLNEVMISGTSRRKVINATDAQLIQEIRVSRSVVSGVSNEQIVRSMDRDVAIRLILIRESFLDTAGYIIGLA